MSCTSEEIAEKRRMAIERLNARKKCLESQTNSSGGGKATTERSNVLPAQAAAAATGANNKTPLTISTFYGGNQSSFGKSSSSFQAKRGPPAVPYAKPAPKNATPSKVAPVFVRTVTCACSIVSDTRFVVETNGFNEQMIDIFKQIPSKSYEPNTKKWTFEMKDYSLLQERIATLNPHVVLGGIPKFVMQEFASGPKPKPSRICLNAIEPSLVESLLAFQKEGVAFAIDKGGRALIADEMGLGKTYQAIAVADFYQQDWPLLVCTTASTRDSWAHKIRQLLPHIPVHSIAALNSGQDYIGECRVLIASYSMMERCGEKLLDRGFGMLIFDESHTLKNFKAKCTTVAMALAKRARRVVLLSGTPALSRPVELFTQLQMLDGKFCSFKEYSTRYCAGKQSNFGWDATGQSNLAELNLLLARKFMIRRTKDEVMSELTEKNRETVVLDPSYLWTNEELEGNMSSYAADYSTSKGRQREEALIKYYSVTAEAKAPAVCAYLKEVVKENKKFIVFAHHHVMLDAIEKSLSKQNVDFIRIDGSTRSDLRGALVERFQSKATCRAAVLSLKACNAGITLTAAHLVLFAELDWNPSTLAQAESRAHRIGQADNVTVRYLLAKKTADDIIWTMLQRKQETLSRVGLCNEDFSDASSVQAPCNAGNIEPFLNKSLSPGGGPRKGTLDGFVQRSSPAVPAKQQPTSSTNTKENACFDSFLSPDDDDDDLAGLEL
ncbi:SWI/SNF-related matrix-associated actin-dependent regulator of chromatin subfamily A-like protein 1 [Anopheles arabiensis]|uniref:AGAP008426-PA n=2 Tax=gambiae species complex TaxID=44542 RepID=Q7Q4J3_ANOGA|nr:SWI/SNF-related matrix-associated actin-dependent regulator of chromatin subfamily A-like protein 1 [Anopheles arabiensis]XP_317019.4 SWI/SNF-related matrix-associated actin-dependent regulator of chromatin subfamily A-like protein 1 [Anopheles gambiae]EAA12838.4 AGAP008426-PA [Anopheles gambiae str. PEST]